MATLTITIEDIEPDDQNVVESYLNGIGLMYGSKVTA